jgi:hypothetical protein
MIDPAVKAQQTYRLPLEERVNGLLNILSKHDPLALSVRTPGRRFRYVRGWRLDLNSGHHCSATLEEIRQCRIQEGVINTVYTSKEAVERVLSDLREADLGISIVVSGVFEQVFDICKTAGIEPHTVNMSLGTWGKTDLLPKGKMLELCTMCGHALVSPELVKKMLKHAKRERITFNDAAIELAKQCTCNIVNTERAVLLIKQMLTNGEHRKEPR